jgi:hypothetical protein
MANGTRGEAFTQNNVLISTDEAWLFCFVSNFPSDSKHHSRPINTSA